MVTPFSQNGEVNYSKAAELAAYLVANGSDGLVVAGTTGESPTLTGEEKLELFRVVVRAVRGKAKVVAGTGSNNTRQTIQFSRQAADCGVDGLMLVTPYYNKPSQEGLFQHFTAVAGAVPLPVMLYNVPGRTGVNMLAETTLRLAQLPNVVAVKEASGDLEQIARLCAGAPAGFAVYSGDDAMTFPLLSLGGCGVVSVAGHVAGTEIKEMVRACRQGDIDRARRLHHRLLPLFGVMFIASNPVPVKTAMNILGHDLGPVRLPLVALSDAHLAEVKRVLTAHGYLS
jgi:4-hydroxy-tetrahydrodipicolinate synthase